MAAMMQSVLKDHWLVGKKEVVGEPRAANYLAPSWSNGRRLIVWVEHVTMPLYVAAYRADRPVVGQLGYSLGVVEVRYRGHSLKTRPAMALERGTQSLTVLANGYSSPFYG